jgi:dihydrofolate reductase
MGRFIFFWESLLKLSVFIATSLDGYIAREDGAIDWLTGLNDKVPEGEDCGYKDFIQTIDVIVMGRNTYETVLAFDPWPYDDKKMIVLSKSDVTIPAHLKKTVSVFDGEPKALVQLLTEQGCKRAYVDGGLVIQSFIKENLIDDMVVTIAPVLIGKGRRLFGDLYQDVPLALLGAKYYDFGFAQLNYAIRESIENQSNR